MFVRCGKLLVIIALVFSTGLHWAALQTVAWTTMLANNLCTKSVSEAVANTFDGEHPCPLCKAITAGKKSENKSETTVLKSKLEFPPVVENIILISPVPVLVFCAAKISANSSFQKPPVPPPRGFFV